MSLIRPALIVLAVSAPLLASAAGSYKEKPGAKDYPLLSRFQGSILANAGSINFEQAVVPLGDGKTMTLEGKFHNYYYVAPPNVGDLEVFRSYQQALERSRFKILYACDVPEQCARQKLGAYAAAWSEKPQSFVGGYSAITRLGENGNYPPRYLVAQLARPEGNVTAILTVQPPSSTQKDNGVGSPYFLQFIESGAMKAGNVTVSADELGKGLAAEGKIALYGVYFDTGKAELKPESKTQLDEMGKLLNQNKLLKVVIVGHTDNQGSMDANAALSQKRAEAVVAALSGGYKIDAKRLLARGVASLAPVASNGSEAGRARNRRVELVEQ
jgi:outer membrane protein OmpA-like peptidoglycan-associated protein